jgi:hypothetical protein
MTYAELINQVRDLLGENASRQGTERFIEFNIRAALDYVVQSVGGFRRPIYKVITKESWSNEDDGDEADPLMSISTAPIWLDLNGPVNLYLIDADGAEDASLFNREPITRTPWTNRWAMHSYTGRPSRFCMGPNRELIVSPAIPDGKLVAIEALSIPALVEYGQNEEIEFKEAARAISLRVSADVAREIDSDMAKAEYFMRDFFREVQRLRATYPARY